MRYATDELRDWLEAALAAETGVFRKVASIDRRVATYHSSWQMEDVDVVYADGTSDALLVKDLSPDASLPEARDVKPEFLIDRAREVEVYRRLLRHAGLDTPRFRGAAVDSTAGRNL